MSTVVVAWVPEGIAVAADSRATDVEHDRIANDYSIKVLYFEEYNFFITLCGDSDFAGHRFEEFIQINVDDYFILDKNNSLVKFALKLAEILLTYNEFKPYLYQMIISGYDMEKGKEIVAVFEKDRENLIFKNNDWYIKELNGYNELEAQTSLLDDFHEHMYGIYVAGIDIFNINENYNNQADRYTMHEKFANMSLKEAKFQCQGIVEQTMFELNKKENYAPVGGLTVILELKNEGQKSKY